MDANTPEPLIRGEKTRAMLERLRRFPGATLRGSSGDLTLDELGRVQRRLPWART